MEDRSSKGVFPLIIEKCNLYNPCGHGRCSHMGFDSRRTEDMVLPTSRYCTNGALVKSSWIANPGGLRRWLGKGRITTWRPIVSTEIKGPLFMTAYRFFSIMPPTFPHAVFTPEDCLAVGGQFYTVGNLGHSIEGLKLQEDHPDISNEDLYDSVYNTLTKVLRGCGAVTNSTET